VSLNQRRLGVPTVLIALAAASTACQDEPSQPSPVQRVLGKGDQYVALGDSYTAAPNTGPKVANNGCFNTEVNYPHRIADATGMDLVDNSCNGATTNALTIPQQIGFNRENVAQLDGVDEDTDLVTIRLGANNDSLFSRVIFCSRLFGPDAVGTPCADADAKKGDRSLQPALAGVQADLVTAVAEIRDRAPEALIVVIGYPRLVPDEGTCALLALPAGDYDYVRDLIEGLNVALQTAAESVDAPYIDMYAASEGHDICAEEPWIAGAPIAPAGATAWHPYAAEGQAVAELVLAELEK